MKDILGVFIVVAIIWIPLYLIPFTSPQHLVKNDADRILQSITSQISKKQLHIKNRITQYFKNNFTSKAPYISIFEQSVKKYIENPKQSYQYKIITIPIPSHLDKSNKTKEIQKFAQKFVYQQLQLNPEIFIMNFIPLTYTQFDQNVRDELQGIGSMQDNMQIILSQFKNSKWMDQCKFTDKFCSNYLIAIIDSMDDSQYIQQEGVYLLKQLSKSNIKQILFDIIGILPIAESMYQNQISDYGLLTELYPELAFLKYLSFCKKQIQYLLHTLNSQKYIHDKTQKQIVIKWEANIEKIILNERTKNYKEISTLAVNSEILSQSYDVGKLQLLPNDYYMGSYLPLVALALYPTIRLIQLLKQNLKKNNKNKQ